MVEKYEKNGSGLCCNLSTRNSVEKLEDYLPPTTFDDLGFWEIEPGSLLYDKVLNSHTDESTRNNCHKMCDIFRKQIRLVLVHLGKYIAQSFKKIQI